MYEIGKKYRLNPKKLMCAEHHKYTIQCATYMGSYEDNRQTSHIFVHVVHDIDYLNWVSCWGHLGGSHLLAKKTYENDGGRVQMVDTHIYEKTFIDGWVECVELLLF